MSRAFPLVRSMLELIRSGNLKGFLARAERAEPADVGEVLASLDDEQRLEVVQALPKRLSSKALIEMSDEAQAEETLVALGAERAAGILDELPDDEAADMLGGLDPEDQARILSEVEDRDDVERLLRYAKDTAGGLMTTQLVTVPDVATAGIAIEEIRRQRGEVADFYEIFVADADRRLRGVLPLKDLVTSPADRPIREFMQPAAHVVRPEVDQEEVAGLLARYNLPAVPVVDADMRLLGQVTFDDVIDVVAGGRHRRPAQVRRRPRPRGSGRLMDRRGAEPAALALCQSGHGVPRRRRGVLLPGHREAYRGHRGLDADHRGDGRQRGHPGARRHRSPARAR